MFSGIDLYRSVNRLRLSRDITSQHLVGVLPKQNFSKDGQLNPSQKLDDVNDCKIAEKARTSKPNLRLPSADSRG